MESWFIGMPISHISTMESWFIGRERDRERRSPPWWLKPTPLPPINPKPTSKHWSTDASSVCVWERESNLRHSTDPRRNREQPTPIHQSTPPPSTHASTFNQRERDRATFEPTAFNQREREREREREEGRLRWEESLGWEIEREVSQGEREIMNKTEYFILAIELQFHHKFRMVL